MGFAQGCQLLRDIRLAFAGQPDQIAHANRTARQDFQDAQPFRVTQRLKEQCVL